MNATNESETTLKEYIDSISDFIGNYVLCAICIIGLIINILIRYLLRSKTLKNIFYKHISLKTFVDTFICLIGIGYLYIDCLGCLAEFKYTKIIYHILHVVCTRLLFVTSSFHEIYLITNRYLTLKNMNNWIVKLKLKYYVPFLVLFPMGLVIPFLIIVSINQSKKNSELYNWTVNVGDNYLYMIYFMILLLIENILPLTILVIMSVLCQIEYKKRIQIKSKIIVQRLAYLKRKERSYTRLTITLTVLFTITRIIDFVSGLTIRAVVVLGIQFGQVTYSMLHCIRQFNFLLYFGLHSFNGIIYIQIDKNLKSLAKTQFSKIKVTFIFLFKFIT